MPIPCVSLGTGLSPPSPPASPGATKKGRSLSKVKSPGTVRRLSMKMKKLPELRRKLSLRSPRPRGQEGGTSPCDARKESSNVISRYHLDTSVASLPRAKAASKGGYLSDGDSPELPAKTGAHAEPEDGESGLDVGAFRPYSCGELPRGGQHISGLVSVHLYGVRDLKPPRAEAREVFCVLQVDAANRARTALLPCKAAFLGLNHTFNLELEGAQLLKVIVFSWDPSSCRNRLCCHGTVVLPHIFRGAWRGREGMVLGGWGVHGTAPHRQPPSVPQAAGRSSWRCGCSLAASSSPNSPWWSSGTAPASASPASSAWSWGSWWRGRIRPPRCRC